MQSLYQKLIQQIDAALPHLEGQSEIKSDLVLLRAELVKAQSKRQAIEVAKAAAKIAFWCKWIYDHLIPHD